MNAFDYDDLKITAPDTPLSVARWNGLVDQLNRVERALNSVFQNGRIGIGTAPERALHIEGTGGVDDDVFLHSSGATNSAALIFAKSSLHRNLVKSGNLLGCIAFRGETGEGFSADAGIRAYATTDFKGKAAASSELRFYTAEKGKMQENITLKLGCILMKSRIAHKDVKAFLKTIGNNQLIIGGAWDDYMYFFWKNKKGYMRRAVIKGSSF